MNKVIEDACLNPECSNERSRRGLCRPCLSAAKRLVKSGVTTWESLEARKKILPDVRHQRVNWLMDAELLPELTEAPIQLLGLITGLNQLFLRAETMNQTSTELLEKLKSIGIQGHNPVWLGRHLNILRGLFPDCIQYNHTATGRYWTVSEQIDAGPAAKTTTNLRFVES